MLEEIKLDKWGYEVKTNSDACISAINAFYDQVLGYGRERSVILEAPIHDKDCVLGNILAAHFALSSGSADSEDVVLYVRAAESHYDVATNYEKAVFHAVSSLMTEDRNDDVALRLHAKLARDFPMDLLSLKRAQILCFYMGQPQPSLDLVQQALRQNEESDYIYGMLAFPFLELGKLIEAERAARKGLEINKQDVWAQHNLCHVLQQECRFDDAVQFMEECSSAWSSCSSFLYTHNWWHVAVCYVEGHSPLRKVLDIYDLQILKELERPYCVAAEVYINALGLLLRLYLRGETGACEDRLKALAKFLTDRTSWHVEWLLDILSLWALASIGELSAAESLLESLNSRVAAMFKPKQQRMQKGLLLAEALLEYGRHNHDKALALLGPDFDACDYKMIGASDEQLDVFNDVWYTLLLSTGNAAKAIEILETRIKSRPGVPFMWRLLEKAYSMSGREEAAGAAEKASVLENAYFRSTAMNDSVA
ncbi:hypothetical protein Droror1_Dr00018463 [Drosera rotundifolia]